MSIARALLIAVCLASCAAPASPPASSTVTQSPPVAASVAASHGAMPIRNGTLSAGTYQTLVFQPQMTVTLPDDGWTLTAGEVADRVSDFTHSGLAAGQQITFAVFRLGQTFNVFADPCNPDAGLQSAPISNDRAALVAWLGRFPLLGASTPAPITIGGRQGVEVKVMIDEAALAKCPNQEAALWGNGSGVFSLTAGSDDRLILIDVGGQMILIPWSVTPESETGSLEPKVRQVVETLTFADH